MVLTRFSDALAFLAVAGMTVAVVIDVAMRYLFSMPIAASIELVELAVVGTVFMALPGASASGAHVSIDYIESWLPKAVLAILARISHLLVSAILVWLAYLLVQRGQNMLDRGNVSVTLNYPTGYVAFAMAVAIAATAFVHLFRAVRPNATEI